MHAVRSLLSCIVVAVAIVIATSAMASRFTAASEASATYLTLHRDYYNETKFHNKTCSQSAMKKVLSNE
jgi:hypothetical protein